MRAPVLLALLATVVLGCSASQRFTRTAVSDQSISLVNYFDEQLAGSEFRSDWYDSTLAFAAQDTVRGKYFAASINALRPLDSLRVLTPEAYQIKRKMLLHDLSILSLTAEPK